jgi:hypothetical protein
VLLWWSEHAKHTDSYETLAAQGKMTALDNLDRPAIFPGNEWIYDAFMTLDSCRTLGMSAGPIPWVAVDRYCQVKGYDAEESDILWAVLHRADTEFRAEATKQAERGS